MQESGKSRGFLAKHFVDIIVIAVLLIIVFVMVEFAVRVYLFGSNAFSYSQMSSFRSTGASGTLRASDTEGLVYELKPGLDMTVKLVPFQTNSEGLRDKDYTLDKPEGTFRVAVIGGSFTMGSGVPIEQTFHTLLEDRLNGESEDLDYEFINFGVAGYTMKDKLAVLEKKIVDYDPDLVLFVLDGSQFAKARVRTFTPREDRYSYFTSYTYKLLKKIKIFPGMSKGSREFVRRHLRRQFILDYALFEISKFSEERGIPVNIVILDHDYQHNRLSKKIEEKVRKHENLYFSNTIPYFRHSNFRDFSIYKVDKHPNGEANKIFSEVLYRDLKKNSLLGITEAIDESETSRDESGESN